jgi:ABC-2 type transport system ATP-binding protein
VTPDLLFLDEPTTGLDPRNRNQVWDIIRSLSGHGCTILLTTQYLEEADQLADRIAVIDNGKIIAEGTSGQLKAMVGTRVFHLRLADPGRRSTVFDILSPQHGNAVRLESDDAEISVRVEDADTAARILWNLSEIGIGTASFSYDQPSLDEVFLTLTGHSSGIVHNRDPQ